METVLERKDMKRAKKLTVIHNSIIIGNGLFDIANYPSKLLIYDNEPGRLNKYVDKPVFTFNICILRAYQLCKCTSLRVINRN